jgi:hypothetical protein
VSAALKRLRPGEITPTPVRSEDGFIIAQRLEPKGEQSTVWQTELPTPKEPDAVDFFGSLPAAEASGFLRAFAGHVAAELALSASKAEALQSLHSVRERLSPEVSRDEQLALFQQVQNATRKLLGDGVYAQYHAALNRAVVATVLGAPSDPSQDLGL